MVDSSSISITPATHADRHIVGGPDPLVNPLLLHASRHAGGGVDEVAGLPKNAAVELLNGVTVNNSWTNIDMSATVGSNVAFVILEIENLSTNNSNFGFRQGGSAVEHYGTAGANSGMNKCDLATSAGNYEAAMVACVTDATGIIQYRCNGQNTKITLIGYTVLG